MQTLKFPAPRGFTDGVLYQWLTQEKANIEAGQKIAVVQTPEATLEIKSEISGVLSQILKKAGEVIYAGDALAEVGGSGESKPASEPKTEVKAQKESGVSESKPSGDVIPILMPQAGQSMEEGTLLKWMVKEGDTIEQGQPIFEIETDKATMEVEAEKSGRLAKIIVGEGTIVDVLVPVAFMADNDADVEAYLATQGGGASTSSPASAENAKAESAGSSAAPVAKVQTAPATRSDSGRIAASPAARKAAAAKGVSLDEIGAGRGPGGRILSTDVEAFQPAARKAAAPAGGTSKMRKAIAKALTHSKQSVPHFYLKGTVDAGPLMEVYRAAKAQYKCSVNDFVVKAVALTIAEFPAFHSQWINDEMVSMPSINIGVAVGTDDGLTVPVVLNADRLGLKALAGETQRIVGSARNGKTENAGKGVFTISNMGMFGVEEFMAIINPPESGILAVGAAREAVVVKDGAMKATRLMTMWLSADHRVVDGGLAALFMNRLKERLESPEELAEA